MYAYSVIHSVMWTRLYCTLHYPCKPLIGSRKRTALKERCEGIAECPFSLGYCTMRSGSASLSVCVCVFVCVCVCVCVCVRVCV